MYESARVHARASTHLVPKHAEREQVLRRKHNLILLALLLLMIFKDLAMVFLVLVLVAGGAIFGAKVTLGGQQVLPPLLSGCLALMLYF
jgi:hypothetical protein